MSVCECVGAFRVRSLLCEYALACVNVCVHVHVCVGPVGALCICVLYASVDGLMPVLCEMCSAVPMCSLSTFACVKSQVCFVYV